MWKGDLRGSRRLAATAKLAPCVTENYMPDAKAAELLGTSVTRLAPTDGAAPTTIAGARSVGSERPEGPL